MPTSAILIFLIWFRRVTSLGSVARHIFLKHYSIPSLIEDDAKKRLW
jgi:hypothetical protein